MIDKGRASLRDSSLLIGGSHYGFTIVGQTTPWLKAATDLEWTCCRRYRLFDRRRNYYSWLK